MTYFAIGAIFKNESHILKEWIEHYIYHGIDHIYLINDDSTDDFYTILKPYIEKGIVTLFHTQQWRENPSDKVRFGGRDKSFIGQQWHKYNFFFLDHVSKYKWFGILDLDEFLYSPSTIDIRDVLKLLESLPSVTIDWVNFGSNGFIKQPDKVVDNFTKRGSGLGIGGAFKSIINSDYGKNKEIYFRIHEHCVGGNLPKNHPKRFYASRNLYKNEPFLLINHYKVQSKEFWEKTKMTRGDADNYIERSWKHFEACDVNVVEDIRLKKQNSSLNLS